VEKLRLSSERCAKNSVMVFFWRFSCFFPPICKPFAAEICTSFGASDKASAPVAADDCPDCISGSHAALKAFLPGDWNACDAYSGNVTASYLVSDRDEPGIISKRWLAPPGQAPPSAELI
jgi:hypothetical protein